ncbi:MAG: tripartite tricarboxylate transporter permease, partial [Acetobacterales bacterium]
PGADMVGANLDLTFTMIWSLALANVLGAAICLVLAQPIARLTLIPYALIGPVMLTIIFFAAFQATRSWNDLIALLLLGVLGIYMKRFGWPRPALLIGYVLSGRLEASVYQSLQVYGLSFFQRPIVLLLLGLTAVSIIVAVRTAHRKPEVLQRAKASMSAPSPQIAFTVVLLAAAAYVVWDSTTHAWLAMVYPLAVSLLTLALLAGVLGSQLLRRDAHTIYYDEERIEPLPHSAMHYILWIAGMLVGAAIVGFPIAVTIFVFVFTTLKAGHNLVRNGLLALATIVFFATMANALVLVYPSGLLQGMVAMPWWLG